MQVLTVHDSPVKWRAQCGNSSVGRARPCQGRGREFESRFPLQVLDSIVQVEAPFAGLRCFSRMWLNPIRHPAGWQSGYAADCKSAYAGSIPTSASRSRQRVARKRSPFSLRSRPINWLEWYRIVTYRDFHDVPRQVLATNSTEDAFWILDAGVDDAAGAHATIYTIHDAGRALAEATERFERHAADPAALAAVGCIPVEHVQFDETGRGALKLTSPPIV